MRTGETHCRIARRSALLALALVPLAAPPAGAQAEEPPDGLPVGKWILAPYFEATYQGDDNVFRRSDENDPESDAITVLTGGLVANLPIRTSMIELGYQASQFDYKENQFSRDLDQEIWTEFSLNFSSHDQLTLRERFNRGGTDMQTVDQGGELVFQGEPFNLNRWEIELTRAVPRRQGYQIRVARTDLNFEGAPADTEDCPADDLTCFPFFDYRGFDTVAEHRQPWGPYNWLLARHASKRFNHYAANRPDLVGIPFRREEQDTYQIGLRGLVSGFNPYFVFVGHGRLRFREVKKGGSASEFDGIVGEGRLNLGLAGDTRLRLEFQRLPLPSNFNTYYLINQLKLGFERRWSRQARYGVDLLLGYNEYGDLLRDDQGRPLDDCGNEIREDRLRRIEGRLEWSAHTRVGFVVRAGFDRRGSNCENYEYDATVVSTGVRVGWY